MWFMERANVHEKIETTKENEVWLNNLRKIKNKKDVANTFKNKIKNPIKIWRWRKEEQHWIKVDINKIKEQLAKNQNQKDSPNLSNLIANNDWNTFRDANGNTYTRIWDKKNQFYNIDSWEVITLWN